MVSADSLKKVAICGAALSCFGAAFFHHRIQGNFKNGKLSFCAQLWSKFGVIHPCYKEYLSYPFIPSYQTTNYSLTNALLQKEYEG